MHPHPRYKDWIAQAENGLSWGRDSLTGNHFGPVYFIAQQVAETAMKGLAYFRGADIVKGHSVLVIADELEFNGPVREACQRLDQYYITTRYPDAVSTGAPCDYFTREQAEEALRFAELVLGRVCREIRENGGTLP